MTQGEDDDLSDLTEEEKAIVLQARAAFAERGKRPMASLHLQDKVKSAFSDEPVEGLVHPSSSDDASPDDDERPPKARE